MALVPRRVERDSSGRGLTIEWTAGRAEDRTDAGPVRIQIPAEILRKKCPCAVCRETREAGRVVPTEGVLLDKIALVGRYAISCAWSDGHATGIYEWEYLDEIARSS